MPTSDNFENYMVKLILYTKNCYNFFMGNALKFLLLKHEFLSGLTILVGCILLLFATYPNNNFLTILPILFSWFGSLLMIDYGNRRINKRTFFPNFKHHHYFIEFCTISLVWCLGLEFLGSWTVRYWYYNPAFTPLAYVIVAPVAFIAYSILILSCYELLKKKFNKPSFGRDSNSLKTRLNLVHSVLFIVGLIGLTFSILEILRLAQIQNFNFFDFNKFNPTDVAWWLPFVCPYSLFVVLEYFGYKQGKETLIKDLLKGNYFPILLIFISSLILVILVEYSNVPFKIWEFSNWPLNDIKLWTLPITAILTWQSQFYVFFSMLRIFTKPSEIDLW